MKAEDRGTALLLVVGLACAAMGQFYFAFHPAYVWDGVLFWVAAVLLLVVLTRRVERSQQGRTRHWSLPWVRHHPVRTLVAVGGFCLSIISGLMARQRPVSAGFGDVFAGWMIGVVGFLAAFSASLSTPGEAWGRLVRHAKQGRWLRRNRIELAGLAVLVVVALALRVYDLEHIPANLGGDEGTQGADALQLVRSPLGNPFSTGWFSVPTMSFLAYGVSMRIFGATVGGLRTLSALIGAATVLTTFLLARELWGSRVAWLSATVLAFAHYHIHFSRIGSNQIGDAFFFTLGLWLCARGLRTKQAMAFAATGATIGLSWYGYFGARLVGVVVGCYLGLQGVLRHRFLARYGRLLGIMLAAAAVALAPLFLYYMAHPVDLASRPRQVNIFSSGWLAREREITGRSTVGLLLQQFWKSISAFNYTLDPTFWYRASIPLLDSVSGLFFVLGLVWAVVRYRWPSNLLLLIWFCLSLLLGWVMTENPPSSQRLVGVAPALAVLVALGLDWIVRLGGQILHAPRTLRLGVVVAVLVAMMGLNVGYYFSVYTPKRVYGNPTAEMATHLSRYLARRGDAFVVYLHGPPFVYWNFGTFRFMARGVTGVDVPPPGEGQQPQPDLSRGARFVFHPARADELNRVRAEYPGGSAKYVRSTASDEMLYAVYEVSR